MSTIDKILEEQSEIFTNQEVFEIANDKNDNFYISCRRIALIFEPIKRVITLLESYMASLADCFLGIVLLAATFRRIPTSNNFRFLAIVAFNKGKFCDICELAVNYYKDLHHNEKEYRELWGVVEDEHTHLQELAKTMFAIVSWLESMAQIYSFYVSNIKKELNVCENNSVKMELCNSMFNETIFAEINSPDLRNEEENEEEIVNPTANEITMAFQDWVNMSDPIFGLNNNQDAIVLTEEEEANMNFESRSLVQYVLSDSDL
ncbi:12589_t:CDS:2, partial [Gigaspora margarita]